MAKKFAVNIRYIPEEMVTEIFLRLPVRSLLQCKSVCKPWLSIISNSSFINSQLERANAASRKNPMLLNIQNQSPRLAFPTHIEIVDGEEIDWVLVHEPLELWRRQVANEALLDIEGQDLSSSPVHFDRLVMPSLFEDCQLISSYNGIICVFNMSCNIFYLWNPTIRLCKKLPSPTRHTTESYNVQIGFCYDSISGDYKALRTAYVGFSENVIVEVYSTNANCWTEFMPPIPKKPNYCTRSNIVVNGILYVDIRDDELVSFDLHNEVFGVVPFPTIQRKRSCALDFKGSLAMVFESGPGLDLWTLDDVSGQVSWTKQFSIDEDPETEKKIWLSCYLGAGQFYGIKYMCESLFLYNIVYDYEKRETKYVDLGEKNVVTYLKYTQTLVSLQGFEQVE